MRISFCAGLVIVVLITAIPLFSHLDTLPILPFDEARLATNALEMSRGESNVLVPTYHFAPDMWNTKPPFLIWVQALFIKLMGANELSFRLPTALAGLATCLLLYWFCAKKQNKPWLGLWAVVVLITSEGYVRIHGTRTGDYDSMLTFFTTTYAICYYLFLQTKRKKYIVYFAISFCFAFLTKGIVAFFFLPALFLFTLSAQDHYFIFRSPAFYVSVIVCCMVPVAYYFVREQVNPGYFTAVMENELGGRFNQTLEDHSSGTWFYWYWTKDLGFNNWIWATAFGVVAGVSSVQYRIRRLVILSCLLVISHFAVISYAETKIDWYAIPMYPFLSMLVAFFFYYVFKILLLFTHKHLSNVKAPLAYLILLFWLFFPYRSMISSVTDPKTADWLTESLNMGYLVKDVRDGKINVPAQTIKIAVAFEEPNLEWYAEAGGSKVDWVLVKDTTIKAGDTVAVFRNGIREYMNNNYVLTTLQNYHGATIYHVEKQIDK